MKSDEMIESYKLLKVNKGGVMPVAHSRGHCKPLRSMLLPLQIARSFACSVASLGRSPRHQLPGHHGLRHGALADYLLGQGRPSTWPTGHTVVPDTTSSEWVCLGVCYKYVTGVCNGGCLLYTSDAADE